LHSGFFYDRYFSNLYGFPEKVKTMPAGERIYIFKEKSSYHKAVRVHFNVVNLLTFNTPTNISPILLHPTYFDIFYIKLYGQLNSRWDLNPALQTIWIYKPLASVNSDYPFKSSY